MFIIDPEVMQNHFALRYFVQYTSSNTGYLIVCLNETYIEAATPAAVFENSPCTSTLHVYTTFILMRSPSHLFSRESRILITNF